MRTWKPVAIAALAAIGMVAGPAQAQNLMTNGSFETGDTTGWVDSAGCIFDVLTPAAPPTETTGAGQFPRQQPTQGTFLLMSDAVVPVTCSLSQDVVLPAGDVFNISLAAGYNYRNFLDPSASGCSAFIDVTTTGGVLIRRLYANGGPVSQAINPRGAVNLSRLGGATVRIIITVTSCAGGPAGIVADNFVLLAGAAAQPVPTLDEWARITLAALMAASALIYLRRRKAAR